MRYVGLQTGIRLPLNLLLRLQYFRHVRDHLHHFLLPSRGRRLCIGDLVLAHFRLRLHVHRRIGRRVGLCVPDQRRSLFHHLPSCSSPLDTIHQLGDGLDQPAGPGCGSCLVGVRLSADVAGGSVHGPEFHLDSKHWAHRRRDGCSDRAGRHPQLATDWVDGEDDADLRYFPSARCGYMLHCHAGQERPQEQRLVCLHGHRCVVWLASRGMVLLVRLSLCFLDHDRLRRDGPHCRRVSPKPVLTLRGRHNHP